jgi:NAD dependent epimerase/dehydratase family enzyme
VNTVAPNPVTNAEFTKALGQVISRPTVLPMPAFAAKLVFGQMGEELLLGGQRVRPAKLLESGYTFKYPELETALRHLLQDA